MRRTIIVIMIATILAPMLPVDAEIESRNNFLAVNSPDQIIIHPNDSLEVPITLQNTETYTQTFTLDVLEINPDLATSGLPLQYTLESNQLRQVKFALICDSSASLGTSTMKLNVTTDVNSNDYVQLDIEILIVPKSNLTLGVSGISQFVVDSEIRTNLAINITNNALLTDNVTFSISTQSSWNWGWTMNQTIGANAFETLVVGQLSYIYLWVEIPAVINGAPLFNTGPRFTLIATSSLDFEQSQWSFDLLMNEYRNISIDSVTENLTLDPSENDRLSITIRNVGNVNNKINAVLEIIDELGQPISSIQQSDRIEYEGWTVALFGALEDIAIQPAQTRTFEIGFQAPSDYFGSLDVRVRIYPIGAISRTHTVDISADIEWQRSGSIELIDESCLELLPGQSCQTEVNIENTGNALDSFEIKITDLPSFLTTEDSVMTYSILPNQIITAGPITIFATDDVLAFENDNVVYDLILGGTQTKIDEVAIPVIIAPKIDWTLENITEEIDSSGRLSVAMTLRNDGNAIDGLIVQLECSHSTKMAFIPPNNAVIEEGVELPRSFEINDLPLSSNFTIRAWADIPYDQTSNGTMYLNTTVRSRFAPDLPFVYTSTADYIGTPWQNDIEDDSGFDITKFATDIVGIAKSWGLIIFTIILSTLILNRALKDRRLRQEENALKQLLYQKKAPEQVEDWMGKFSQNQNESAEIIESPKISSAKFENAFKAHAGAVKLASDPIEPQLREAATLVLDVHDKSNTIETADNLLEKINTEGIAVPHSDNDSLEMKPVETSLTTRNDPRQVILDDSKTNKTIQDSVPLPTDIDEDDLDI